MVRKSSVSEKNQEGVMMARTIGRHNISVIRKVVDSEIKKRTMPWGEVNYPSDKEVIEKLPEEMWDTWEGADSEIRNLIHDFVMSYSERKLKKVI